MSEQQQKLRQRYTSLLVAISSSAANVSDTNRFLDESLTRIGTTLCAIRTSLFEKNEHGEWNSTHEWLGKGAVSQERVPAASFALCAWLESALSQGRSFCFELVSELEDAAVRSSLQQRGVAFVLGVPLCNKGVPEGLFVLEQGNEALIWPSEAVEFISSIAHILLVTRSKAALAERLKRESGKLQDMLDAIPGMSYAADFDTYEILLVNRALFTSFGNDILGKRCYEVFQHLDAPCAFCSNHIVRHTDEPYTWLHHSDVLNRTVQVTDRRIQLDSGKHVKFSFNSDVTDLLDAQRKRTFAEEEARAKSDFLARMSHEIRTPMNAIIGFTHLLGQTEVNARQRDYLDKTRIAANGLLHIINDILDFSRIEAGKMRVDHVPFRLSALLAAVHSISGFGARDKGLEFSIVVDPSVPDVLRGDPGRLNQVLINLLSNAVKFTSSGSVTLRVHAEPCAEAGFLMLHCQVKDTGIGMLPEQLDLLFQPFSQADGSVMRKFGGTGLGLVISKRLVELMGGDITVRSRSGEGSEFACTIRVETGNELEDRLALQSASGVPSDELLTRLGTIKGSRVLIVDDNDINLEIASELLSGAGMQVEEASGGEQAVTRILTEAFDLVFMDMQMPEVDGLEATRRVREQAYHISRLASLPIVAMTANVMAVDRQRCFDAGMNDHIGKPLDPTELMHCLLHWIPPRDQPMS